MDEFVRRQQAGPGGVEPAVRLVHERTGPLLSRTPGPFLGCEVAICKLLCSANAIESLNARDRRAVKVRGRFPTERATLKCLYLITGSLGPTGRPRSVGDALEVHPDRLRVDVPAPPDRPQRGLLR